ncbi:MAG: hypothetical protein FJY16_04785 [Bacteroidetes bacterium]|nr:hypothetical protein [Bacteroidota bacterium]
MKVFTKTSSVFIWMLLGSSTILLLSSSWLKTHQVDVSMIWATNFLLFLVAIFSANLIAKSFINPNPQASIRAVMLSFIIKFFVLAFAAFIYIYAQRQSLNLPALYGAALLYVMYAGVEVKLLLGVLKK